MVLHFTNKIFNVDIINGETVLLGQIPLMLDTTGDASIIWKAGGRNNT